MLAKTKTGSLIMQKQLNKQKSNPQSNASIAENNGYAHTNNYSSRNNYNSRNSNGPSEILLGQCPQDQNIHETYNYHKTKPHADNNHRNRVMQFTNLTYNTLYNINLVPESISHNDSIRKQQFSIPKTQSFSHSESISPQYCQLEKQNYRLIEANYNMLNKFSYITETMRSQLLKIVQFIEQYLYVEAIKNVYSLLDLIKRIGNGNKNALLESIKFYGLETPQNKESKIKSLNRDSNQYRNFPIKQFEPTLPNDSIVSQYHFRNSLQKQKVRNPIFCNEIKPIQMSINIGVSQINYIPVQKNEQKEYNIYSNLDDYQDFFDYNHKKKNKRDRTEEIQRMERAEIQNLGRQSLDFRMRMSHNSYDQRAGYSKIYSAHQVRMQVEERSEYSPIDQDYNDPQQSRLRPVSENNVKIIKPGNKMLKSMQRKAQNKDLPQQLYQMLLLQAQTIQSFLK